MNAAIRAQMDAVGANVLTERSLMLKTCEHGIRHPVGHVDEAEWRILTRPDIESVKALELRHERATAIGYATAQCCGCCPHRA